MGWRAGGAEDEEGSPNETREGVCGSVEDIIMFVAGMRKFVCRGFKRTRMEDSIVSLATQHVLSHFRRVPRVQPMFVALQGPQGSGKTYLTRSLVSTLSSPPHSLRLAVLSVDDLYLPHSGLRKLATDNPGNKLWNGRGQPGTHDVELGAYILRRLQDINAEPDGVLDATARPQLVLPSFDKSKYGGEGDRAAVGTPVKPPIDIFILEGWSIGFYPLAQPDLDKMWMDVINNAAAAPGSLIHRAMEGIRKGHIEAVNHALRDYVREWYGFFEVFIQVSATFISMYLLSLSELCSLFCNNTKIRSPTHSPHEYIYTVGKETCQMS